MGHKYLLATQIKRVEKWPDGGVCLDLVNRHKEAKAALSGVLALWLMPEDCRNGAGL